MSNKANKGSFRIISGKYKGRKFEFLPSSDLRPTPDRLGKHYLIGLDRSLIGRLVLIYFLGQVL